MYQCVMNPYLSILTAAIIFGSSGFFIKTVNLPVSTITLFRMAVPFVFISLYFLFRKKRFPSLTDSLMLVASVLNAVRLFFYFAGYTFGNISTTVILLYTWPVFATVWSVLFMKETLTLYRVVFFVMAIMGLALINMNTVFSLSDQHLLGVVCILLSALIYSMTIVMFKKRTSQYDPLEIVWFQNGIGALVFLPFLFTNRPLPFLWQSGLAGTYAFLIGVLGFSLFFYGLGKIEASKASFLTYIEVVSAVAFGVFVFDERLTWNIVLGGGLILFSSLAFSLEGSLRRVFLRP